jgi:hypothetical protein
MGEDSRYVIDFHTIVCVMQHLMVDNVETFYQQWPAVQQALRSRPARAAVG